MNDLSNDFLSHEVNSSDDHAPSSDRDNEPNTSVATPPINVGTIDSDTSSDKTEEHVLCDVEEIVSEDEDRQASILSPSTAVITLTQTLTTSSTCDITDTIRKPPSKSSASDTVISEPVYSNSSDPEIAAACTTNPAQPDDPDLVGELAQGLASVTLQSNDPALYAQSGLTPATINVLVKVPCHPDKDYSFPKTNGRQFSAKWFSRELPELCSGIAISVECWTHTLEVSGSMPGRAE